VRASDENFVAGTLTFGWLVGIRRESGGQLRQVGESVARRGPVRRPGAADGSQPTIE